MLWHFILEIYTKSLEQEILVSSGDPRTNFPTDTKSDFMMNKTGQQSGNSSEMHQFQEIMRLLRLNAEERKNMNFSIMSKETKSVLVVHFRKVQRADGFIAGFYQIFK